MSSPDCPCRNLYPETLEIPAGLSGAFFRPLRSLGSFPQWRQALLESIGRQSALDAWRAREAQDLGVMLVEMGAYVADVVSFYDAVLSGESYLRTATLPGSRRELVSLLGYRPRPAVASQVLLAAKADGTRPVHLPAGTAFRSSEFLDEHQRKQAPQVFELTEAAALDPRINALTVGPVKETSLSEDFDRLWVKPGTVRLKRGDAAVLDFSGTLRAVHVESLGDTVDREGQPARELRFTAAVTPPAGARYDTLRILAPGIAAQLWHGSGAVSGSDVLLHSRASVRAGEALLFVKGSELKARTALSVGSSSPVLLAGLVSQILKPDNSVEGQLKSPDITVAVTRITLSSALGWSTDLDRVTVYHSLSEAAQALIPLKTGLEQGDPLALPGLMEAPRVAVERVLLEDAQGEGLEAKGSLRADQKRADLDPTTVWAQHLKTPVKLWGNVLSASRGETVKGEVLGRGDASRASLQFKLQKKPLTYIGNGSALGRASTLQVRVGGVLWKEVPSFFGCRPEDPVYLVRHDDEGETYVSFGGGARPGTGAPILADYRFGAGAAQPPAGAVSQLAKPAAGLKTVKNLLPAFGGADAESPAELASSAPRSALLLGRAVSLMDLEAAAAQVPGAKAVRAAWRMDEAGLQPAAVLTYIGDAQLLTDIFARLRKLSEPDAPIRVVRSQGQAANLSVQLEIDADYGPAEVQAAALAALYAAPGEPGSGGLLRPERLGPGGVIFLSAIVETLMAIEGVVDLQSLTFNQAPPEQTAFKPLEGRHWDFGTAGMPDFGISLSATERDRHVSAPKHTKLRRMLKRRRS